MDISVMYCKQVDLVSVLHFDNGMVLKKKDNERIMELVNSISNALIKLMTYPSLTFVGLLLKQSIFNLIVIMGCLKLKIPFVCLDNESDHKSNDNIISSLHVSAVITIAEDAHKLTNTHRSWELFEELAIWNLTFQIWLTRLDGGELRCSGEPPMMFAVQTSGSTGEPKVVRVPEQSILPNIQQLSEEFCLTADDVVLVMSPPTFDPFMVELLLGLTVGATLLVVPAELRASPRLLLDSLFPADAPSLVTVAQFTPSVFMRWTPEQIHDRILTKKTTLRVLLLGGEKYPGEEFWRTCRASENRTKLYNLYGTTELSCWAMMSRGIGETLGSAMTDTLLKVVSESGDPVDNGTGELFIGSERRLCLVGDEKWDQLKPPVYRATGDIVTVQNGMYMYVGRRDNMVKRWGHRMSLDQVEGVAGGCGGVTAACCLLHDDMLVLFVTVNEATAVDGLRPHLTRHLRKAAVPDVILVEPHLPLNRHGKINKNKLKQKIIEIKQHTLNIVDPVKHFEELWKTYSCMEGEADVGFVSGGGNSVAAMQVLNRMRVGGFDLSVEVLSAMLNDKTLNECCQLLGSPTNDDDTEGRKKQPPKKARLDSDNDCIVQRMYMKGSVSRLSLVDISDNLELKIAWSHNMGKCVDASPTCITFTSGQSVAVCGSHSGLVSAVDLQSGLVVWSSRLADRVESSLVTRPGNHSGVIGCYDGHLYCLSLTTGSSLWTFPTAAMVKGVPLIVGQTCIFGSYDYHVYCVALDTSELVWKRRLGGIVAAGPVLTSQPSLVVVASLSGQVVALCPVTGQPHWQATLGSPVFSTPCVTHTAVLVAEVAGTLHALHPASGQQCWELQVKGEIFSSLVTDESDNVVFGCHNGSVYCVRGTSGETLWSQQLGSAVYATPSWAPPHYIIAATTSGTVCTLNAHSGQVIASITLPGQVFSSPVIEPDARSIIIGSRDNHLYCLKINKLDS